MAEGDGFIYNRFKKFVMDGVYDLSTGGDTLAQTLHTAYTPDIDAHLIWLTAGVSSTEYGTANGYTAGGKVPGSQDTTQNDSADRGEFDYADILWSSLGALSPATPSDTILWDNTPTSPADPLISYWELGSTATNGGDYTLQVGANGAILLT